MLTYNPAQHVELPRRKRKEMRALSPEKATRFLEAAKDDRHGIIFACALATGARPEEYMALKWSDVEWQKGSITIQRVLCWRRQKGGWYFGEPKTSENRRTIPIPAPLVHQLTEHKRKQAEMRLKLGAAWQNLDLVFTTADGSPPHSENLSVRHFKPILRQARLPETIRLYDLRHSCATLLLAAGVNPKIVSERLGQASIVLTLDTYSHVLPTMQQSASEKLGDLLFSRTGTL
jgi:integrase